MTIRSQFVTLSFVCAVAGVSIPAAAEEADKIIVTGTRLPQPAAELGSSVSVITLEDLEKIASPFVLDAVATAPGVTVNQTGPFGGVASVRIRGAATGQTLVLIDGVPVNDTDSPGGGYDFNTLNTLGVERVEVLRGPNSTLWGTDAMGGVVNIVTRTPDDGLQFSGFGEYGSFDTYSVGGLTSIAGERGFLQVGASHLSTDGISAADEDDGNTEKDGYELLSVFTKAQIALPADARLTGTLRYGDSEFDIDGGFPFGDTDDKSNKEEVSAALQLNFSALSDRLENEFLIGYSEIDREINAASFDALNYGQHTLYRYQGTVSVNEQNRFAFGAERDETESKSAGDFGADINGIFGLYEWRPTERVTLTGGARLDDHDTFGSETTFRAAARWEATDSLNLRATWGEAFKAPTLFQLTFVCDFCVAPSPANQSLKPETSEAFDVGADIEFADGRGTIGVTYFQQDFEDMIGFFSIPGAAPFTTLDAGYDNIDVVETEGVEIVAGLQITEWLSAEAGYTYIDAKDGTGTPLIRVPENTADLTLSFDNGSPLTASLFIQYNDEEVNDSFGNITASWTRADVTAAYDINEKLEVYGRIENLTDEDYQQVRGFGTPGLSGKVGIRLNL